MELPFKINLREKRFLVIGGVLVFLIILYRLAVWHDDISTGIKDVTDAKLIMLEKQSDNLSKMALLQEGLDSLRKGALNQDKSLLKGDKPPVAAAELQSILKGILSSLNIEIRSERTLTPVEAGFYLGVPVEIGLISDTAKLKGFLYRLKRSRVLLTVSELRVRVTNLTNPENSYVTLVITGFIKAPPDEETAKRG
jgi:hypothetical protein